MTTKRVAISTTIPIDTALSGVINIRHWKTGAIAMPAAWTAANIGFVVSSTAAGTFLPLNDAAGDLVEIASPAVNEVLAFPAELESAGPFIKLWSQNAGADEDQVAARTLVVYLVRN